MVNGPCATPMVLAPSTTMTTLAWAFLDLGLVLGHTYDPVHLGWNLDTYDHKEWPLGGGRLQPHGRVVGSCGLGCRPWTPTITGNGPLGPGHLQPHGGAFLEIGWLGPAPWTPTTTWNG
jgi:hypothetical protein